MSGPRAYLDYNATAPLRPQVRESMMAALDAAGNPSSMHFEGRAARGLMEKARIQVAALVGAQAKSVIFTSGGTEAANLALTPYIDVGRDKRGFARLGICAVEHACILKGHRFPDEAVDILPVDAQGRLDLAVLEQWLAAHGGAPLMLALQYANNETGVIQPVREAADMVHAHGGILVCDAVQAAGKVPLSMEASGADLLILSAHKFGGPKGAGALILASDGLHIAAPLIQGGGQEKGARAGTPNVAAIAGFGAAAELAAQDKPETLAARRADFEAVIRRLAPGATIFAADVRRLPNVICFAMPDTQAETLLIQLDLAGVALSSGSACSSGKVSASHVLKAMNVPDVLARGALRLSFGWATSDADLELFTQAFSGVVKKVQEKRGKFAA